MATRKAPRKRRTRKKKKKSGSIYSKVLIAAAAVLGLGAIAAGLYFYGPALPTIEKKQTIELATVESVLISAGVNLKRQRQVNLQDDVTRWKVTFSNKKDRDSVLRALKHQANAAGVSWKTPKRSVQGNDEIHLVNLASDPGELRLILVVPNAIKPKPKPAPKPKPTEPKVAEDTRPDGSPMIAIILDDIGHHEVGHLNPVLDLKFPVTFAVLPYLAYSYSNAVYFHQNQYEIMLHMPMEPSNYPKSNPGEGAIMSSFTEDQVRSAFDRAIKNVPFVSGVNNHMGSKVTSSRALMTPVLQECKRDNLYFIDSRTNSKTVAYTVAKEMNMRTAKRDVFLDAEATYEFAKKQMRELRKVADRKGYAILIGHPYKTSLQALAEEMPKMDREGYRFVFVTKLLAELNQM